MSARNPRYHGKPQKPSLLCLNSVGYQLTAVAALKEAMPAARTIIVGIDDVRDQSLKSNVVLNECLKVGPMGSI